MKAAIVLEADKAPVYGDFKDPVPGDGEVRINVTAAALSNVVRSRASGTHYSSSGDLPFVVGIDGVGRLDDGRRVYFVLPKPPRVLRSSEAAARQHVGKDCGEVRAMRRVAGWAGRRDGRRDR